MLLELANHDASFAVDPVLKTEGVIDLIEDEAMQRFDKRMKENGGYMREQQTFVPAANSVTTDPIPFARYYVDFRSWERDLQLTSDFARSIFIGHSIYASDAIREEIHLRYFGSSQKTLIAAFKDTQKKYKQSIIGRSKAEIIN